MAELTARFDVPIDGGSPHVARHAIHAMLACWGYTDPAWLYDAMVVVAELVSNAVRHGGGCVEVDLQGGGDGVMIGVADGSAVVPRPKEPGHTDGDGRGLLLLEALTTTWGVVEHKGGKRVWARLHPHPTRTGTPAG